MAIPAHSKIVSGSIQVDKWDYIINPSNKLKEKTLFAQGSDESLERLEGKTREGSFFKIQSGKISV